MRILPDFCWGVRKNNVIILNLPFNVLLFRIRKLRNRIVKTISKFNKPLRRGKLRRKWSGSGKNQKRTL